MNCDRYRFHIPQRIVEQADRFFLVFSLLSPRAALWPQLNGWNGKYQEFDKNFLFRTRTIRDLTLCVNGRICDILIHRRYGAGVATVTYIAQAVERGGFGTPRCETGGLKPYLSPGSHHHLKSKNQEGNVSGYSGSTQRESSETGTWESV